MALPYPNVPDLPGVPQVPRQPGVTPSDGPQASNAASQGSLWQASQETPKWGIFDGNGNQVVTPDSVYDFGYHKEWDISQFPVQAGGPTNPTGFANYNKVELPFEISVRMTKGGSESDRATFLQQVASIGGTTNLYTVLTPENSYQNCNVTRTEVTRRGASGAYFLAEVEVFFQQIIQTTPQYTNTQLPNTANAADATAQPSTAQGNVSPTPVTAAAQSAATGSLGFE